MNLLKKILKYKKFIVIFVAFIVLIVVGVSLKPKNITVVNTQPQNGATDVSDNTDIVIIFNRELSDSEVSKLSVEVDPSADTQTAWDQNTLTLHLSNPLNINTVYTVEIKYKNKDLEKFSFKTSLLSTKQKLEEGPLQSEADFEFGEAYKKFITDYPWYQSLPIESSQYRIVYDFDKEKFRIRLKVAIENKDQENEIVNIIPLINLRIYPKF